MYIFVHGDLYVLEIFGRGLGSSTNKVQLNFPSKVLTLGRRVITFLRGTTKRNNRNVGSGSRSTSLQPWLPSIYKYMFRYMITVGSMERPWTKRNWYRFTLTNERKCNTSKKCTNGVKKFFHRQPETK